jgi:hypothetical protein
MFRSIRIAGLAAMLAATTGLAATNAQVLAGLRSEWADLSTWSRALENRDIEHGLGLHANGAAGQTMIAFMGIVSSRNPTAPPRELSVQVSTGRMTNPNLMRAARLTLVADEGTPNAKTIDLSSRLTVDNPAPGMIITDGIGRISADEFARLAIAKSIKGNILGFDFTLRADQVAAIKAHAVRLKIAR